MSTRRINAVDVHVGRRVRAARLAAGISQEKLGTAVGVTFQQVQKYENGVNRIGPGRLHAMATALAVPVSFFFEGLDERATKASPDSDMAGIIRALSTKEGMRIAIALSHISNPNTRRRIADLLEAMIADEREGVGAAR